MPRRLSGKPSKQSRNDPSRVSSGRIHAPNRIPRFLRIPDLPLERDFIPTVAFGTHRNGRNRDSFAFRTAGRPGAPYHCEFTRARGHQAGRAPTQDNLLVFYLPDEAEWTAAVDRMKCAGFAPVPAFNPYWDRNGVTFEDPDGYRIVFQHDSWTR